MPVTILPDPHNANTKLYIDQKLLVTVKIVSASPIPANQTVTLEKYGMGFLPDDSALGIDYTQPQPVIPDPSDSSGKTGLAKFVLYVKDGTPTTSATNLDLLFTSPAFPPTSATYKTLAERPTYVIPTGPSKPWMQIPPTHPLTPQTGPDYTTVFSIAIRDGSTPIPYCVVDWHEKKTSELDPGLFFSQMSAFVDPTSPTALTTAAADQWPYGPVATDPESTFFLRTVTDSHGVASIYLVANSGNPNGGYAVGDVEVEPLPAYRMDVGAFAVAKVDLAAADPAVQAPDPGNRDGNGDVDYDLTSEDTVPVIISLNEQQAHTNDRIFMVINGEYVNRIVWTDQNYADHQAISSFPKVLGYVGSDKRNTLQFLWADLTNFRFHVSQAHWFYGNGNPTVLPNDGAVRVPYLSDGGNLIDNPIAASLIKISVLLISQTEWVPASGDIITPSATIVGWDSEGEIRNPVFVPGGPQTLTDPQVENALTTITLPNGPFQGWSSSAESTIMRSTARIRYTVARPSTNDNWESRPLSVFVLTPGVPSPTHA